MHTRRILCRVSGLVHYLFFFFLSFRLCLYSFLPFFASSSSSLSFFLDSTTHLYKRLCPSIGQSISPSVCLFVYPVLFSNDEKHHVLYSNDDEISHGPRESWRQFKNDIKMSVHWSVCTSGWEKNDKMNKKCRQSSCILCTPRYLLSFAWTQSLVEIRSCI